MMIKPCWTNFWDECGVCGAEMAIKLPKGVCVPQEIQPSTKGGQCAPGDPNKVSKGVGVPQVTQRLPWLLCTPSPPTALHARGSKYQSVYL